MKKILYFILIICANQVFAEALGKCYITIKQAGLALPQSNHYPQDDYWDDTKLFSFIEKTPDQITSVALDEKSRRSFIIEFDAVKDREVTLETSKRLLTERDICKTNVRGELNKYISTQIDTRHFLYYAVATYSVPNYESTSDVIYADENENFSAFRGAIIAWRDHYSSDRLSYYYVEEPVIGFYVCEAWFYLEKNIRTKITIESSPSNCYKNGYKFGIDKFHEYRQEYAFVRKNRNESVSDLSGYRLEVFAKTGKFASPITNDDDSIKPNKSYKLQWAEAKDGSPYVRWVIPASTTKK